jgi:hypothetical protein
MFKYIKWELLSLGKKNLKWLGIVLGLYFLVAILPISDDQSIISLLYIPFFIVIGIFYLGAFLFGTKKVIDTFRKKTFLLESMISFNPYQILLAKYIMAIILNIICVVIATLGIVIFMSKSISLESIFKWFLDIFDLGFANIIKLAITIMISSLSFTSLVTLCYVIAKCIVPNGKGSIIIGAVIWYFNNYFTTLFFSLFIYNNLNDVDNIFSTSAFLLYNLLGLIIIAIYYFITVKLIESKLEIYN